MYSKTTFACFLFFTCLSNHIFASESMLNTDLTLQAISYTIKCGDPGDTDALSWRDSSGYDAYTYSQIRLVNKHLKKLIDQPYTLLCENNLEMQNHTPLLCFVMQNGVWCFITKPTTFSTLSKQTLFDAPAMLQWGCLTQYYRSMPLASDIFHFIPGFTLFNGLKNHYRINIRGEWWQTTNCYPSQNNYIPTIYMEKNQPDLIHDNVSNSILYTFTKEEACLENLSKLGIIHTPGSVNGQRFTYVTSDLEYLYYYRFFCNYIYEPLQESNSKAILINAAGGIYHYDKNKNTLSFALNQQHEKKMKFESRAEVEAQLKIAFPQTTTVLNNIQSAKIIGKSNWGKDNNGYWYSRKKWGVIFKILPDCTIDNFNTFFGTIGALNCIACVIASHGKNVLFGLVYNSWPAQFYRMKQQLLHGYQKPLSLPDSRHDE